jgi:reductive dehalogenase
MKTLSLNEWERKYITGHIERYDQMKIINSIRQIKSFNTIGEIKDKPGFTLIDQALRIGAWAGVWLDFLDTSKPNPPSESEQIAQILSGSRSVRPFLVYRAPDNAKCTVADPSILSTIVKKVAALYGADIVGICRLDRRWLYSPIPNSSQPDREARDVPEECQYAIVLGVEMDYQLVKYYPTYIDVTAPPLGYSRLAFTSKLLSAFITVLGKRAINCATNQVALYQPLAMQAGLGEIGRNGVVITPRFGPRVRFSTILTDLTLIPDSPIEFGVTEFCGVCRKCADMCPSHSIPRGERSSEPAGELNNKGTLKWQVNTETCRIYWAKNNRDCGTCISVCPYNKVSTWQHRTVQWLTDHARWADRFFVKMDNLFGYGKPRKAVNFWEEWEPNQPGRNKHIW